MDDLVRSLQSFFDTVRSYGWWTVGVELFLIGFVVFWVLKFLQGTRGARVMRGIAFVLIGLYLIVRLVATRFSLERIGFLYSQFLTVATTAIVVVFQPELRRAMMRLAETRWFRGYSSQLHEEIDILVKCAMFCSKRKQGALIAIEREVGLGGIAESGIRINADLNADLLNTIFWPNTPLHDLGVIISQGRIAFAAVQFPLAESGDLEKELGSRHRAAVGLSQETDAIVMIISEETGDISIAERGALLRKLTPEALAGLLAELLGSSDATISRQPPPETA